MISRVCIDASIGLKLVVAESDSERVERLWQSWTEDEVEIVAPPLFLYEGISVLRAKVFRSYYLALAELLDCELWTADERLFNTAKDKYPRVKWIGQVPKPT